MEANASLTVDGTSGTADNVSAVSAMSAETAVSAASVVSVASAVSTAVAAVEPTIFRDCSMGAIYVAAFLCICIFIISTPFNFVTLLALIKHKLKEQPASFFLFSLTLSDLVLGGLHAPLTALTLLRLVGSLHPVLATMMGLSRYMTLTATMLSMMGTGISRLVLITQPALSHQIFTIRNTVLMVTGIWTIATAILIPTLLGIYGQFGIDSITGLYSVVPDSEGNAPRALYYLITFLASFSTMTVCYVAVFWKVRSSSNRTSNKTWPVQAAIINTPQAPVTLTCDSVLTTPHESPVATAAPVDFEMQEVEGTSTSSTSGTSSFRRLVTVLSRFHLSPKERKLVVMIMAMLCSLWFCYLPLAVVEMYEDDSPAVAYLAAHVLLYMATCANPAVYMLLSEEYRDCYVVLFRGRAALARRRYI